ncbi:flagellar filament capping protein FliD [Novosphingobium mangrovi (ex Huang et al. 2023)]|uniref:Flagellar hook-associated protein 2 n=1 Tax=Novosphingobium mangrovi (ex Huang et al. 2023) TaxID=2976432 RepID=A0ABT2I049_9SPHN|nr:flagellar filament capping protein FliD [Novosphingobium mangrovi (ex Huang et al. 2023)]MCT2398183.1 flagellar filament capping protein FliD [Novosphingobium mangrovi (ex Huang et al. 2023)]
MATDATSSTSATSSLKTTSIATLLGAGSGIDMAALANNLATAQFELRTARLNDKTDTLNTRISTASNIKSMLLSLDTSLGTLVRSGDLAPTPSVANSAVATASLSGSTQPTGSYSLEVSQLATGQQLASSAYTASTDTVGAGTLTLRFGTVSGSAFTEDAAHAAVDITINTGDTLADVAAAINASGAGVNAYIANTTSGAQLVIKGAEGAANGFIVEAAEDVADPGLSNLAWSPGAGTGTLMATAQDAAYSLDGLAYTSASNTITDPVPGLKLQLTGTNVGTPTQINFSDPSANITGSMQDLTDALNEVASALNAATSRGGDLVTDPGARALKQSLSKLSGTTIMPNATGVAKTLADLGLSIQRDGTFALDKDRLSATMTADPDGVAAMFTNGVYGVYATIDKIYRAAASTSNTNSLAGSITKYNSQLTDISSDLSDLADQQEKLRARLASQFTASEARISVLKSTQSMLQNQIDAWNNSGN